MTAPGWREQAGEAFWAYLKSMGYGRSEPTRDALAAALDAAEPLIRAEADKRRIPGSEMYMAGVAAERERCAGLAEQHRATYRPFDADLIRLIPGFDGQPGPDPLGDPFADLIRGDDQ